MPHVRTPRAGAGPDGGPRGQMAGRRGRCRAAARHLGPAAGLGGPCSRGMTARLPPTGARRRAQEGERMKAVAWHGKRDVRVDSVPDPTIEKPTDAIVRITTTAIC